MKVLLTGAAGMLGSAVYPAFVRAGHEVVATDLEPRSEESLPMTVLDVRDLEVVQRAIETLQPDVVAHLRGGDRTRDLRARSGPRVSNQCHRYTACGGDHGRPRRDVHLYQHRRRLRRREGRGALHGVRLRPARSIGTVLTKYEGELDTPRRWPVGTSSSGPAGWWGGYVMTSSSPGSGSNRCGGRRHPRCRRSHLRDADLHRG